MHCIFLLCFERNIYSKVVSYFWDISVRMVGGVEDCCINPYGLIQFINFVMFHFMQKVAQMVLSQLLATGFLSQCLWCCKKKKKQEKQLQSSICYKYKVSTVKEVGFWKNLFFNVRMTEMFWAVCKQMCNDFHELVEIWVWAHRKVVMCRDFKLHRNSLLEQKKHCCFYQLQCHEQSCRPFFLFTLCQTELTCSDGMFLNKNPSSCNFEHFISVFDHLQATHRLCGCTGLGGDVNGLCIEA